MGTAVVSAIGGFAEADHAFAPGVLGVGIAVDVELLNTSPPDFSGDLRLSLLTAGMGFDPTAFGDSIS